MQSLLLDILGKLPRNDVVLTASNGFSMTGSALDDCVRSFNEQISHLPQGTRVATLLPDAPETAISLLAMVHHVQVLPINPALSDHEILGILNDAKAQILLTEGDDARGMMLAQDCGIPCASLNGNTVSDLPCVKLPERAPGLILLTSGSTGLPKRVPLTPTQLHLSAKRIAKSLQLGPMDRAVHALPMFHIGAIVDLLLAPLSAGGSVHFAGGMDAESLRRSTLEHDGTWLQLVPTMLARLQAQVSAKDAQAMGQKLRFIRSVSSDLAPESQKAAEAFFGQTPIIQMYGMTETSGQITTNLLPPEMRKLGSVGRAIDVDMRLQQDEIQVKGPCVTVGYEGLDPHENFTNDGWLKTGDLGHIDADGFLFLTGRIKEMINRGGEKISPHEVEHAALSYEYCIEAAAYARAHPTLGEEVGLAVTLSPEGRSDALTEHLKNTLAAFKVPRKLLVLDPLPRLGSGKIDRRALAEISLEKEENHPLEPLSKVAELVATAWCSVLKDVSADSLTDHTDFFDAGGDSLSGAQFLFEVERLTKRNLPANLLYEAPEFGAFVRAVETAPIRQIGDGADPKHVFLQSRLAQWDAPSVPDVPFMRVLHPDAPDTPLFWCAQEENEYQQLAKAFTDKRPLYLMRSLFLMHGKNDAQNHKLAQDYAEAITMLQPTGEILLGGFCEGAKIMRFAAEHLIEMGRQPRVLVSWDQWFDTPLDVPVLHLWSDERYETYRQKNLFPEKAIALAHPIGFDVIRVGGAHTEVLTEGPIEPFIQHIENALSQELPETSSTGLPVFDTAVFGKLNINGPRFFQRSQSTKFQVSIENKGVLAWQASQTDPLFLIAQIQNLDGHFVCSLAGHAEINQSIKPYEIIEVEIAVQMPQDRQPIKVSFDIVDSASHHASQYDLKKRFKYLIPKLF